MTDLENEKAPSSHEASQALHVLIGEQAAETLLGQIRAGFAHPDALAHCVTGLRREVLRGFGRAVQKELERSGAR